MNLYGAEIPFVLSETKLTPSQIADKVDLAYVNLADHKEIYSLSAVMGNGEVVFQVVFDVPEQKDAQDFTQDSIYPIVKQAVQAATLPLKIKVASPMRELETV